MRLKSNLVFGVNMIQFILAGLAWTSFAGCHTHLAFIYVSPNGKDIYEGSQEKPMRSLSAAIIRARESKSPGVLLKTGTYYIKAPIKLDARDSGTKKTPFIIRSIPGEKAIISGGKRLDLDWRSFEDSMVKAAVPTGLIFDQLFVGGQRQVRARYPNYDPKINIYHGHSADAINPQRVHKWINPRGGFVHAMHVAHWGGYHYEIMSKGQKGTLELKGGYQNNRQMGMHKAYRFVENIYEELDAPGEWYLDTTASILYFYPPKHIDPEQTIIEVSGLRHLFEITGTPENPVRHIHLEDLELTHTGYTFMETKESLLRSDWTIYRGGAILIQNAEHCQVNRNHFLNLGGNGVFVNAYSRGIAINSNHFEGLGASAILFVGDPKAVRSPSFEYHDFVPSEELDRNPGPKTNNYPAQCMVYDNLIHEVGQIEKQTAGVQISMASEITLRHNSIYNLPRAGINISEGTWGGHLIEHNDVFNTVLETGDHGSFNSWGRDRFWHPDRHKLNLLVKTEPSLIRLDPVNTTIIRNNRFRCDHGWDIDLDDGSTNYHIYNNLCLNGGLKLREGFNRTVENNILVNNSFHPHVWFENSGDVFRKNIVMTSYRPIRLDGWGAEIDHNFFPDSLSLATSQASMNNQDQNSRFGNPEFIAPESGNFNVKSHSPALMVGFKNFPMDLFGVKSPHLKDLAEQPDIPALIRQEFQAEKQETLNLLGMTIKNIAGLEERSAAGLNDENGAMILDVISGHLADQSGLKKGDVIVKCWDHEVKNIQSMYEAFQGEAWRGKLELVVIRNQRTQTIMLTIR
jgi:hypothetical protein